MTPAARLTIDGVDVTSAIFGQGGALVSMTITDEAGVKSDALEIELDDREGFKAPKTGAVILAWLGYEPAPVYMGKFKVDSWTKSGPRRKLTVSATAAELTSSIRTAKVRSWAGKTVGEIVRAISAEHGLTATVAASIASVAIAHIDQQHESDLGFLSRLAKRSGATFKLADGKVIFAAKGDKALPTGAARPTITITPGDGGTWSATSQSRGDHKSVKCSYMDHAKGKRVTVSAGSGSPAHRDRRTYGSEAEARQAARAQLGELTRGKVSLETSGIGRPDIFAEALVRASGFDPDVDGEFTIKTVRHTFTKGGFSTDVTMEAGDVQPDLGS